MSEIELKAEELKVLADKTRLKIMSLLRERKELSLSEISKLTGRAKSTIVEHLKLLLKDGYIDRRALDKGYIYFLTEKGLKIFPLLEKETPSLKIKEVKKKEREILRSIYEIDKLTKGKVHLMPAAIAGLSMTILGYLPLSSIILSILVGLILGLLRITPSKFIKSAVTYAIFTTLSVVLRISEIRTLFSVVMTVLISATLSFLIFTFIGGVIFLGVKLIIREE